MMQTAIHICSLTLDENVTLNPINSWDDKAEKVMFLVRAEQPLENALVQLVAENKVIWSSTLRQPPANAVNHPFSAEDDHSIVYVTNHFVTYSDLKEPVVDYSVQIIDTTDEAILNEVPFMIHRFESVVEESEVNQDVLNSVLSTPQHTSLSSYTQVDEVAEEQVADEEDVSTTLSYSQAPLQERETASVELEAEVATETEDTVQQTYVNRLPYNIQLVGDILVAADQQVYMMEQCAEVALEIGQYEIVIERLNNYYIAVINDPTSRPMFLLENGQYMKQWEDDFESYLQWLKEQLSLMFNISVNESNKWSVLLIDETIESVANEKVTLVDRIDVASELTNYATIIDVTENGTTLVLNFDNGAQTLYIFDEVKDIQALQKILPKWQEILRNTAILPTGLLAMPDVLSDLSSQFKETSSFGRTSLAWELVAKIGK